MDSFFQILTNNKDVAKSLFTLIRSSCSDLKQLTGQFILALSSELHLENDRFSALLTEHSTEIAPESFNEFIWKIFKIEHTLKNEGLLPNIEQVILTFLKKCFPIKKSDISFDFNQIATSLKENDFIFDEYLGKNKTQAFIENLENGQNDQTWIVNMDQINFHKNELEMSDFVHLLLNFKQFIGVGNVMNEIEKTKIEHFFIKNENDIKTWINTQNKTCNINHLSTLFYEFITKFDFDATILSKTENFDLLFFRTKIFVFTQSLIDEEQIYLNQNLLKAIFIELNRCLKINLEKNVIKSIIQEKLPSIHTKLSFINSTNKNRENSQKSLISGKNSQNAKNSTTSMNNPVQLINSRNLSVNKQSQKEINQPIIDKMTEKQAIVNYKSISIIGRSSILQPEKGQILEKQAISTENIQPNFFKKSLRKILPPISPKKSKEFDKMFKKSFEDKKIPSIQTENEISKSDLSIIQNYELLKNQQNDTKTNISALLNEKPVENQINSISKNAFVRNSLDLNCEKPKPNKIISQETKIVIIKNLQKLFDHYVKLRLKPNPSKNDFEQYSLAIKHMRLREFLDFCEDFKIKLYECPKTNFKGLQILFKLLTNPAGLNYDKFLNILKHIALKVYEESNQKNIKKISKIEVLEEEKLEESLIEEESVDYFGKEIKLKVNAEKMTSEKSVSEKMTFEKMLFDKIISEKMTSEKMTSEKRLFEKMTSEKMLSENTISNNSTKNIKQEVDKSQIQLSNTKENLEHIFFELMLKVGIDKWQTCQSIKRPTGQSQSHSQQIRIVANNQQTLKKSELNSMFRPNLFLSQSYKSRKLSRRPKNVFEKLYFEGISTPLFYQNKNETIAKLEKLHKPISIKKLPKRQHVNYKFDSYSAKENYKKQAHFLQHINWEIISKMSFTELVYQMQEKLGSENFLILQKTVNDTNKVVNPKKQIHIDTSDPKDIMTFEKKSLFLNYGKRDL